MQQRTLKEAVSSVVHEPKDINMELLAAIEKSALRLFNSNYEFFIGSPRMTLCSAPVLITGDVKLVAEDMMKHENNTLAATDEARGGFKLVAAGSGSGSGDFCCPPVVDSSTWLTVVGGMAVVVFFLRQTITAEIMGRRRRSFESSQGGKGGWLLKGMQA